MSDPSEIEPFEEVRGKLTGLAYRLLGSVADAEDAVQDTYLKWAQADRRGIRNPAAWLTTACTRRCVDILRSAYRKRVDYVGAWLPEPVYTPAENPAEAGLELDQSLTTAFLLVLERLTPRERAAYLLHEIFDVSYAEIADTLDMQESACRKLVSRAKTNISRSKTRYATPRDRQDRLLAAFRDAIRQGRTGGLSALLSDDVRLSADGGGKVPSVLEVLEGRDAVSEFIFRKLPVYWQEFDWETADINGTRGFILTRNAVIQATVTFGFDAAGRVIDVFIVRNPDKLAALGSAQAMPRVAATPTGQIH